MSDDKKQRFHHAISIPTLLSIIGLLLAIGGTWASFSAENADSKRRITNVEQKVDDDRVERRRDAREIKEDVKETKRDVQTILRKLDQIEATQKAAERRR